MKGVPQLGRCVGNWLTAAEGEQLLAGLDRQTLRGKRDAASISLLLGCGLRRSEAVGLKTGDFQRRDGRWAIVDLVGKAGHVRTVPVPGWVKSAVETWTVSVQVAPPLSAYRFNPSCQLSSTVSSRSFCGVSSGVITRNR